MMHAIRPVGRGASARKYDLLTALGAHALAQPKAEQRRVLRLMTLITARYNWGRDELAVGQREIAAMWSVDERTVKREMAQLRARGWLLVKRQGARGRVTEYRLGIDRMLTDTQPAWASVGPDFALRMGAGDAPEQVVPLPVKGDVPPPDLTSGTEWVLAQALLHAQDAGSYTRRDAIFCLGAYRTERSEAVLREIVADEMGSNPEGCTYAVPPTCTEECAIALKSLARLGCVDLLSLIRDRLDGVLSPRAELDLAVVEAILDPEGPQLRTLFARAFARESVGFATVRLSIALNRLNLNPTLDFYLKAETSA